MKRFFLLKTIQNSLKNYLVVCNIGLPSQELYKINDKPNYFYMLGSMGLASSIGLGLALSEKKNVSIMEMVLLMNLSTFSTIAISSNIFTTCIR